MKNFTKCLLIANMIFAIACSNSETNKEANTTPKSQLNSTRPLMTEDCFNTFRFGTLIQKHAKAVKLIKKNIYSSVYEVTDPKLLLLGPEIQLHKIEITTWNEYIKSIRVIIDDPYKSKFFKMLIDTYGQDAANKKDERYTKIFKEAKSFLSYDSYKSDKLQAVMIFMTITEVDSNHISDVAIIQALGNVDEI